MSHFSPTQIDTLLAQTSISDVLPWSTNDENQIDAFYREVCDTVMQSTETLAKFEWGHYGSGYASFTETWLYRPTEEFRIIPVPAQGEAYVGLVILLSRLAPYFVLMEGGKYWHNRGGSSYLPSSKMLDNLSTPAITLLAGEVQAILENAGLTRLYHNDLCIPLDTAIVVPTILTDPPYTEFDALFYWED